MSDAEIALGILLGIILLVLVFWPSSKADSRGGFAPKLRSEPDF